MNKNLFAYKVGLGVIGVFVIIMAIFVILQANGTKQDAATDKAANKIADKLNSYIETNQIIPDSLAVTGVKVPSSITYTKLGSDSYKFCATYKANSSGFDATSAVIDAASGYPANNDPGIDGSNQSYTKYSLYIDTAHHKGENCQTIKPLISQSSPLICRSTYQSQISVACPAINPTIYNPEIKTNTSTSTTSAVCTYGAAVTSVCKEECSLPKYDATLRYVDAEVTKVSTAGGFSMTVKDLKGYSHVVKLSGTGQVFDSRCTGGKTSDIIVLDKVRIVAPSANSLSVKAGDANDNFMATEIVDLSE